MLNVLNVLRSDWDLECLQVPKRHFDEDIKETSTEARGCKVGATMLAGCRFSTLKANDVNM